MSRPRTRFTRPVLAALFAVGFLGALISCVPEEAPSYESDAEARTRLVAAMSWQQQDYDTRTALCESIALFGPDMAADQIAAGFSTESAAELDPDITIDYITEQCVAENLWPIWATSFPDSP